MIIKVYTLNFWIYARRAMHYLEKMWHVGESKLVRFNKTSIGVVGFFLLCHF